MSPELPHLEERHVKELERIANELYEHRRRTEIMAQIAELSLLLHEQLAEFNAEAGRPVDGILLLVPMAEAALADVAAGGLAITVRPSRWVSTPRCWFFMDPHQLAEPPSKFLRPRW